MTKYTIHLRVDALDYRALLEEANRQGLPIAEVAARLLSEALQQRGGLMSELLRIKQQQIERREVLALLVEECQSCLAQGGEVAPVLDLAVQYGLDPDEILTQAKALEGVGLSELRPEVRKAVSWLMGIMQKHRELPASVVVDLGRVQGISATALSRAKRILTERGKVKSVRRAHFWAWQYTEGGEGDGSKG